MTVKKKTQRTPKLIATNAAYIDPLHCDSTISYKVVKGARAVWGSVQITDCNRKVEWYFGSRCEPVDKVSKAISMLEEFRTALSTARAERGKGVRARRKTPVTK